VVRGEIGAPRAAGDFAGMAATVRSAGGAGAEEAEPRSRFPGLGPVVELLFGFRVGVWGRRPQRGLGRSPKVWPL
jgi:hypothetical protein